MTLSRPYGQLTITEPTGEQRSVTLTKSEHIVGRSTEVDISFPDNPNISRKHARFLIQGESVVVQDLGSKNGTFVNGRRVQSAVLHNGSVVSIGKVEFLFTSAEAPKKAAGAAAAPPPGTPAKASSSPSAQPSGKVVLESGQQADFTKATVIHRLDKVLERLGERTDFQETLFDDGPASKAASPVRQNKDTVKLKLLYDISKELISIKPLDEFLDTVVHLGFQVVDAERVFLMMLNEAGELVPSVFRIRDDAASKREEDRIRISKTITDTAVREKIAILTTDAQADDRFAGGQSIVMMGIRSAMCVPLLVGEKVLGVIYVDSRMSSRLFDTDDLALLSAFANHAAIGIEQARLNEKIRKEIAIRSTLERYHSPEVINTLLETGREIKPSVKEVTILYADIKGFTTMTEVMSPDEVADLLNEYYSIMTSRIFANGGTLDKFMGDAVMAIWGSPVEHPDDAARAVRSAVEMQQAVEALNASRPEERGYQIRIGINTGKAITGDFGSEQRMEFTALGNTVNIAARIEHQVCLPGKITIGEETARRAEGLFTLTDLGDFPVKGIRQPIRVFQVEHEPASQEQVDAARTTQETVAEMPSPAPAPAQKRPSKPGVG